MKPEPSEVTWRGWPCFGPRKFLNRSSSGEPGGSCGMADCGGAFRVWLVAMFTTVGSSRPARSAKESAPPAPRGGQRQRQNDTHSFQNTHLSAIGWESAASLGRGKRNKQGKTGIKARFFDRRRQGFPGTALEWQSGMRRLDAHAKLLSLLCFLLVASGSLLALAGPSERQAAFASDDAFDQIVPGMTRAEDLATIGFDTGNAAEVLSTAGIQARFLAAGREQPGSGVRACLRAQTWCTGYVFHPVRSGDLLGEALDFAHPGKHRPDDIVLLVMNGRVVHKVIFGEPPAARQLLAKASF